MEYTNLLLTSRTSFVLLLKYNSPHHINSIISYDLLRYKLRTFVCSLDQQVEPHYHEEAFKNPRWCKAMNKKIHSLESNHTWKLVDLTHGK